MIVDDFTGEKEREISVKAFSDQADRAFHLIMWQLRDLWENELIFVYTQDFFVCLFVFLFER